MSFGLLRFPKNDRHFLWTDHSKSKMIQYFISESKIRGIIKKYDRIETGIVPNTVAVMKRNDKVMKKSASPKAGEPRPTRKNGREELWVMYQKIGNKKIGEKLNIISVWRYPGVSPKKEIPIPEDVLFEIENI